MKSLLLAFILCSANIYALSNSKTIIMLNDSGGKSKKIIKTDDIVNLFKKDSLHKFQPVKTSFSAYTGYDEDEDIYAGDEDTNNSSNDVTISPNDYKTTHPPRVSNEPPSSWAAVVTESQDNAQNVDDDEELYFNLEIEVDQVGYLLLNHNIIWNYDIKCPY